MCGNRCRQEGFGGLHHDWVGSSKANRGGSAIRHERDGVGTTPGMAQRDGMHGGGDGEHRFLVEKKLNAAEIAELAHGRLRQKMPQIAEALEGHRMTDHHRFLIGQCLKHMQYIDEMIGDLDKQIQEKLRSYSKQVQLACTVPGIAPVAAASILAEIGMDMSPEGPFPDCHHLASWAAICPGNNESAGKIKSGHTRRGNRWLRATLAQTALAGAAKKNSRFQTRYQRLKLRRGAQRAATAVAHAQLIAIYWALRMGTSYQEQLRQTEDQRRDDQIRHHLRQLTKLGYQLEQGS